MVDEQSAYLPLAKEVTDSERDFDSRQIAVAVELSSSYNPALTFCDDSPEFAAVENLAGKLESGNEKQNGEAARAVSDFLQPTSLPASKPMQL